MLNLSFFGWRLGGKVTRATPGTEQGSWDGSGSIPNPILDFRERKKRGYIPSSKRHHSRKHRAIMDRLAVRKALQSSILSRRLPATRPNLRPTLLHTARAVSTVPRIAETSFWKSLIPKPWRRENRPVRDPNAPKQSWLSKEWNPATFFIIIFLLIGSMSIQMISLRNRFDAHTRRSEVRIGLLREVIEKLQRGEKVDVEKVLGSGDPEREAIWEEGTLGADGYRLEQGANIRNSVERDRKGCYGEKPEETGQVEKSRIIADCESRLDPRVTTGYSSCTGSAKKGHGLLLLKTHSNMRDFHSTYAPVYVYQDNISLNTPVPRLSRCADSYATSASGDDRRMALMSSGSNSCVDKSILRPSSPL